MQQNDAFDDLRKAKEEEYFRNKEAELLEKLRKRGAAEADRKGMAEALQAGDPQILDDLRQLGYNADTVKLLFAVPLIQLAWSDGSVSEKERRLILELAQQDKQPEGPAHRQLAQWLDEKPSEEFFATSLRIIASLVGEAPEAKQSLLSNALRIAEASGGILGLAAISSEERAILERVTAALERR